MDFSVSTNLKSAVRAYNHLMQPVEEAYNMAYEMSYAIDYGEFAQVEFPYEEEQRILHLVAEKFGEAPDEVEYAIMALGVISQDRYIDAQIHPDAYLNR